MAKKKTKASAKRSKTVGGVTATIVLDGFDGPAQYVNHAEITHSQHEFIITWAQIAAKQPKARLEELSVTHELLVEPLAQLMMPPTLIPSLIRALTVQLENYEKVTGRTIRDKQP